jgi:hypothetical protein
MNLDDFLIRLIILLVPGIVGYKIFRVLQSTGRIQKRIKDWEDFFNILVFSVVTYFVYYGILYLINFIGLNTLENYSKLHAVNFNAILNKNLSVNYSEVFFALLISPVIGALLAAAYNKKILNKLAKKLNITKKYGEEDVWSFIHNSEQVEWVFVRDHKLDLLYFGYIYLFSDIGEKRELLLQSVDVFDNESGDKLYSTNQLYICRDDSDLSIEIPDYNKNEGRGVNSE